MNVGMRGYTWYTTPDFHHGDPSMRIPRTITATPRAQGYG